MIMTIARRELLEHSRNGRIILLIVLNVILMPLGMYAAARDYGQRHAVYSYLLQAQQRRLAEVDAMPSHERSRWGWHKEAPEPALRALRSPRPLSIFTVGVDRRAPAYWQFAVNGKEAGTPPVEVTTSDAGATLDMSVSLQILLSLLALIVTVDAIAAERESGTLRATLSAPIPRAHVVVGKWLAAMTVCSAALIAGVGAGAIAVQLAEPRLNLGAYVVELVALTALGILFLGAMTSAGLFISACFRSARTALVVGMVAWTVIVFIQPRIVELLVQAAAPSEPPQLVRERRDRGIEAVARQRQREMAELWRSATGNAAVPTNSFPVELRAEYDRARAPMEESWFRLRRQAARSADDEGLRAAERRRVLRALLDHTGPVSSLTRGLENISGTGEQALAAAITQVEAHQRQLEDLAFDRSYGIEVFHPEYQLMISWDGDPTQERDRPPTPRELPGMVLVPEPRGARLAGAIPSAIALGTMTLAGIVGASVVLVRKDVVL